MSIKTATLNGVATIEIARPEKKNAITGEMYHQMAAALDAAKADGAVRAVLITGQPGIFTSGNDIEDFMKRPPGEPPAYVFMRALMGCDKPVIAAVTGAAIGIGTTMLLHCDFVYVSDEARLAMPFVSLGLVPEFASSLIVPQLMGNVRAAEKLLLGDPFTGADAVECGIANAVLPAGRGGAAMPDAWPSASTALPPGAVRESKTPDAPRTTPGSRCSRAIDGRRRWCFAKRLSQPGGAPRPSAPSSRSASLISPSSDRGPTRRVAGENARPGTATVRAGAQHAQTRADRLQKAGIAHRCSEGGHWSHAWCACRLRVTRLLRA